jgi:dihydroorotate dehydrogenase (NAD+) catalytic subunit
MSDRTRVTAFGVTFENPVIAASGCFGYGLEFEPFLRLGELGGVSTKGLSLRPCAGNPGPRIAEVFGGMLNAIGLENVGVEAFLRDKLPRLSASGTKVIANVWGNTVDEYAELAARLSRPDAAGVAALEVNISCPNVKVGGTEFGNSPERAAEVTRAVRAATPLPLIVKLSPNATDVAAVAKAVAAAGADALSLINTLVGTAIDFRRRSFKLANRTGGLSGPAVKPVALRMVVQVRRALPEIPILGIGGISTWEDAAEFFAAGADLVQVGTAHFINPRAGVEVAEGLDRYLEENDIPHISALRMT